MAWIRITDSFLEVEHLAGIGVQILQGHDIEIANLLSTWGRTGLHTTSVQDLQIRGGTFGLARRYGILIDDGTDILIDGTTVTENSQDTNNAYEGIASAGTGVRIQNIRSGSGLIPIYVAVGNRNQQKSGILVAGGDDVIITGNDLRNNATSGLSYRGGTSRVIRDNIGFVTRNSGTAVVANGTTAIVVNHGLDMAPNIHDISVTPTNNLGLASKFWLSTITPRTFTINVDASPGPMTATFTWTAEVK